MPSSQDFRFGSFSSSVYIQRALPRRTAPGGSFLVVCDTNTLRYGRHFEQNPLVLEAGEAHKTWSAVEAILGEGRKRGLGRDGTFVGVGGGVVCDLTAFAASVYMRGAGLALVPTTLLAMADAAIGGKTGFDLGGIKNFAGSFYPAARVIAALDTLDTLPEREWKSGMAELVKTAILDTPSALDEFPAERPAPGGAAFERLLRRAVRFKGLLVERDPLETGGTRELLNLGHTFAHALEAAAGLGTVSHGEAVAWGIARSCELGGVLGITPPSTAAAIRQKLEALGYELRNPWPGRFDRAVFKEALIHDKKKRSGTLRFVVPAKKSARIVPLDIEGTDMEGAIESETGKRTIKNPGDVRMFFEGLW
ncbi:MAG: 3-dehydroquinate synthase [Treponema sp.]|jgi:3-dehydroquinate synthase|nr:3-dehydroquinate synthase [Treponema sp.]